MVDGPWLMFNDKSGTVAVFLGLMAGSLAAFTLGPVLNLLFMIELYRCRIFMIRMI